LKKSLYRVCISYYCIYIC